jgi:hypothetical protein
LDSIGFFILCRTHSSGDHGDQGHGHLMKRLLITRKFVNFATSCLPYLHVLAIY